MSSVIDSPPRAPPAKYRTPLGTRWEKEKAAAGTGAFDYPDDAKFVGPWVIGECVGKGASGHVKIAKHRKTGQLAAVKILPLQPFVNSRASQAAQAKSEKQRMGVDREITMMKLMNHPNIMRIYDVYEGETELYLILEFVAGGELFDFLVNRGKLPPLEALGYFKQIIYGLNYAHTFSIIHRDLKPENILIHNLDPPLVKIADWGMAAFAPPTLQLETSCGSPHYASPEIVNGHRYTGTATDIWSCGVILYALLTGRLPFDDKNVRTLLGKVKAGKYDMPVFIDPMAKDLLSRMLIVDVKKRISMADILAHPWLQNATPGILYVPAPPVAELAKPVQSEDYLDRDLFQSLCVIWGRHANVEHIKADLLRPAGEGMLAKAFYFLLQKHRERAMEEHGILMDDILKSPGKVVIKQYSTPMSRVRQTQSEIHEFAKVPQFHSGARSAIQASRSPSPARSMLPIGMERTTSRDHPQPPIGPRPQRVRPTSSPVNERIPGLPFQPMTPQLQRPRRSDSSRPWLPPIGTGPSSAGAASSGTIHAPVPRLATEPKILPMITAPKVGDAELQKTIDQYANIVNEQVNSWNTAHTHAFQGQPAKSQARGRMGPPTTRSSQPTSRMDFSSRYAPVKSDKENADQVGPVRMNTQDGTTSMQGGLGFGSSVPMSIAPLNKEMSNLMAVVSQDQKELKKHRSFAMDIVGSPSMQKRSVASAMTSPNPMSPGANSISSPAVGGEFKGWFSNLFHWKVQSYLVYSTDDVTASRTQARRILEGLGISALEDYEFGVLKCRADEIYDGTTQLQKAARFRVEFAPATMFTQPHATPRIQEQQQQQQQPHPLSPQMSYVATPKSRTQFEHMQRYDTVIALFLEKGSVTTFKAVHKRLREEFAAAEEAAASPMMLGSRAVGSSIDQRVMGDSYV